MSWLESFLGDLRYAVRQLRQSPGFALVAVLSLALGIGANTSIFQLVNAVRLRTLPVEKPEELVTIDFAEGSQRSGWFSTRSARLTYALWEQIRERQQGMQGVFAWSAARFNLAAGGEARYAEGLYVSGEFFRHLGVNAIAGRTFTLEDDRAGCGSPGAVLSYAFWQREFAGDPGVVGRSLSLDGHPFPVIGVTPPGFFGVEVGSRYDVAIPLCADPLFSSDGKGRIPVRHAWWLSAMGRLKPGWTPERANAQMQTASPGIMQAVLPPEYRPDQAKRFLANKLTVQQGGTGVSGIRKQYETPLWLLMATTALVLLIACANLANLLLARASVRQREVAVRLAIGASRARLVRQLLAESLLLAVLGSALGAGLAQALSRGLVAFLSTPRNPLFLGLGVDTRVLGFTAAVAVGTCVLFGLLPALRATHLAPSSAMRAGARGATAGRERFGLRRALVVTQVALSLVLLVGALLFVRTLHNLMALHAGFEPGGILVAQLDLRRPAYPKERLPAVRADLLQRMAALPGVVSAAETGFTPVSGSGWDSNVLPDGPGTAESGKNALFNRASPAYFRTLGIPLLAGREFTAHDTLQSAKVAIVNEEFARKFFHGANVIGRTFRVEAPAGKQDPQYQIVGLVRNTKYYNLREDFRPIAFFPMAQDDNPWTEATFVLRSAGSLAGVAAGVKAAAAEVNPAIGIEFHVFQTQLKNSLLRERLMAALSGAFGLLAALLATLGLYGVIAYMVARRRNEIGVRIALGADRGRVVRLVLRESVFLLAGGLTAGTLLALWASRAAATLLYGLKPYDPATLAAAAALLTAVALLASYAPARRAAALEPMAALREE
jgi:predicted permease